MKSDTLPDADLETGGGGSGHPDLKIRGGGAQSPKKKIFCPSGLSLG